MPPKGKKSRKTIDSDEEQWKSKETDLNLDAIAKRVAGKTCESKGVKSSFAQLAGTSSDEDSDSESDSSNDSDSEQGSDGSVGVSKTAAKDTANARSLGKGRPAIVCNKKSGSTLPKDKKGTLAKKGKPVRDESSSGSDDDSENELLNSLVKSQGGKGKKGQARRLEVGSDSDDTSPQKRPMTKKALAKAKAKAQSQKKVASQKATEGDDAESDSSASDSENPEKEESISRVSKGKGSSRPASTTSPAPSQSSRPLSKKELEKQKKEFERLAREAKKKAAQEAKEQAEKERREAEAEARKVAALEEQKRAAEEAKLARLNRPLPESRRKRQPNRRDLEVEAQISQDNDEAKVNESQPCEKEEKETGWDEESVSDAWDKESVSSLNASDEEVAPAVSGVQTADVKPVEPKREPEHTAAAPKKKKGRRNQKEVDVDADGDAEENATLRSPILCIMGHVDTGKTKLLDKIRHTNVQDREAGGITQQIGATFFPREALLSQCSKVDSSLDLKVPGLLIIDTPGHASFNNLRKRGSSLCDIAILVVDIMHGLEPQTRESIGLLRQRKCPFVIALNKIDRLYGWVSCNWSPVRQSLKIQKSNVKDEFETRTRKCLLELTSDQGLNCELYWENPNLRKNFSVVPTSAITGEGIPDLLTLIVRLTQTVMTKNIVLNRKKTECTVLEVKAVEGLGTTIDVILIAGALHEGDNIVVCGMSGPIVTSIRALLTPHPMKELRVKGEYIHHETIYAAMGVKIAGNGLEEAVAGTQMMIISDPNDEDEIEDLKEKVQEDMGEIFKSVSRTQEGVYVVASTLGSLEALLDFLKESSIPVSGINIGTVWKLDVKKASTMRERGREEYSVILAFDVKIDPDAEKEAKLLGVKIMSADIIYHLFDGFTKHLADFKEDQRQQKAGEVVFPCVLRIIPDCIFNKKDPLILGVKIEDGELRVGTPLVTAEKPDCIIKIGNVESIEVNKKSVKVATKGQDVCVKITGDPNVTFGRTLDATHRLFSRISRNSIDVMKAHFVDDLQKHARLVVSLKKVLGIV